MASSLWEQRWQLWRWYWSWYWMQWAVLFCELTLFGVPISVYRVVAIHNTVRNSFWRGRTNVWVIFQKDLEKAPKRCWQYLVVKNLPKIYGLKLWGVHWHLWTFSYMCFVGKGGGVPPLLWNKTLTTFTVAVFCMWINQCIFMLMCACQQHLESHHCNCWSVTLRN